MLIRAVDFETTGMPDSEGGAAICEIGYCDLEVTPGAPPVVRKPVAFLVNPGRPIPPEIRAIHHIGDSDVADAVTPAEGLKTLMHAGVQSSGPDFFLAHNCTFEQAFFAGAGRPWLCTYRAAVRVWPDAPAHSNQVLRYWLGLELDHGLAMPPHRAGPDAFVTAHILARMLERGNATIEEIARWASGPPLLPKVNFGKHFGSRWEDVPTDYLRWIVDKSDMDNDIKANARHHLKKRES